MYAATASVRATQTREQVFTQRTIVNKYDPKNITLRESRDSDVNPESTAIIVGLDVTGSMGMIAEHIAKKGLGTLVETVLDRGSVTDPHFMMMAVGDISCDSAPLQVTQFEADIRISDQLAELYLEGGGGGNNYESYDLPWIFAARKTSIDCFEKRGKKGYLFTIGDELPPTTATAKKLTERIGITEQQDYNINDYLAEAQEKYHVFHVIVEQGSYALRHGAEVHGRWQALLGKRAITLSDYKFISEVITAVIEVNEGADPKEVIEQYQNEQCRKVVETALFGKSQQ
jgi:hypothetical protein